MVCSPTKSGSVNTNITEEISYEQQILRNNEYFINFQGYSAVIAIQIRYHFIPLFCFSIINSFFSVCHIKFSVEKS